MNKFIAGVGTGLLIPAISLPSNTIWIVLAVALLLIIIGLVGD